LTDCQLTIRKKRLGNISSRFLFGLLFVSSLQSLQLKHNVPAGYE
jgi:hypothetical protein